MPKLHDELAFQSTACVLCSYLDGLDPAAAAEWRSELAQPVRVVGHTAVVNALARRNVRVSETSIRRHRRRHGTERA